MSSHHRVQVSILLLKARSRITDGEVYVILGLFGIRIPVVLL